MIDKSVTDFLFNLAAKTATPGGGSVAALNGAMGAALVSMVCKLTIGKKKYAAVENEAKAILEKSEVLQKKLTELVTEDAAVFDTVMTAYSLPRKTDAEKETRATTIENALKEATLVPLATVKACAEVITLSKAITKIGNANAVSDGGVGALAAQAGLKGAALNVLINLGSIKDQNFTTEKETELNTILAGQDETVAEIYEFVKSKL